MSSPRAGKRRTDVDLLKLIQSKHQVTMLDEPHEFCVRFYGPAKTPYENGIWNVKLHLTEDYPFKSPSVGFMNRIFHPNIDEVSGSVCMNVLNQAWSPLYDLSNIVETFLPQLLTDPNPEDPLNKVAASLYLRKPEEYKRVVKKHIWRYASERALRREANTSSCSDSDASESSLSEDEL